MNRLQELKSLYRYLLQIFNEWNDSISLNELNDSFILAQILARLQLLSGVSITREDFLNSLNDLLSLGYLVEREESYYLTKFGERTIEKTSKNIQIDERDITQPLSLNELNLILGSTIKQDDNNKGITLLCMISAYTKESQFNVNFRAPSSTGKSYIPLELSAFFPEEDLKIIAGASPTSFFHEAGIWDEKQQAIIIDLEKKILIFLDQPHDQLLQKLRPFLSHDKKELIHLITDKKEKRGLRTKRVILKGFSSILFCTGSLKIDEQESTRNFILSPETNEEKIREGIYLKALRKGNPLAFREYLESKPEREFLRRRIEEIKNANIQNIIIKKPEKIVERFLEKYPKLKPRHMRDIERLISLIQGWALLNLWYREKDTDGNLYTNEEDEEIAFSLYDQIAESQELGIPPYIHRVFKEIIEPAYRKLNENETHIGLTRNDISKAHFEIYGILLPDWLLRQQVLPCLELAGLIIQEPDPNDKRKILVHVTTPLSNSRYFDKPLDSYLKIQ